jgi:hypothetical protein
MASCEMYPLFRLKSALKIWQENYCESEYTTCVRYQRARDGQEVEPNLLPNGKLLLVDMGMIGRR